MNSVILITATRLLLSLILLVSVWILFRGHNEPGGGFIGGLVATAAFVLLAYAQGVAVARSMLVIAPARLAGIGVVIAAISGLPALLTGAPFLTGLWWVVPLDGGGKFALGTPILFDIGVYLAVIGGVLSLVFALEEEGGPWN